MGAHSARASDVTTAPGSGPPGPGDRVWAARRGDDPTVIAKLRSGFVALGESQFLPGYCLLVADADEVDHLTDLPRPERELFLADMGLLGEAVMAACTAWDPAFIRINYEILGNHWRHLHAHLFPRYSWEPAERQAGPVWGYPRESWDDPKHALGPKHDRFADSLTREINKLVADAPR